MTFASLAPPSTMKTAVALRHIHVEDLGMLAPLLAARGYAVCHVEAPLEDLTDPALAAADLLVVLGGPIGAGDGGRYPWLADELALIAQRLRDRRPILGICLGAQLIARALGASVHPLGVKEIGFGPVTLTDAGKTSVLAPLADTPVLHWHGDQFDIPAGASHLAGTAIAANQAFAVDAHVLGLQFHLEADPRRLEPWLVAHAGELVQAGIDPRVLRAQARSLHSTLPAAAAAVVTRWLNGLDA